MLRGYLLRDGEWAHLVDGTRAVERDDECRPARITVDAIDERGRTLHAVGRARQPLRVQLVPAHVQLDQLHPWEFDGIEAWGEDQDVWHPGQVAALRPGAPPVVVSRRVTSVSIAADPGGPR